MAGDMPGMDFEIAIAKNFVFATQGGAVDKEFISELFDFSALI